MRHLGVARLEPRKSDRLEALGAGGPIEPGTWGVGNENRQRRHERSPTDEEFRGLGRVLHEPERRGGGMEHAAMAIRLLLTGCQKNESLSLGWDNLDLEAVVRRPNLGAYILNLTGGNPALASVGTNVTQRPMTGKTTLRRPHCS